MENFEQPALTGDWNPRRDVRAVFSTVVFVLMISPWLAIGIGLLLVGGRSLSDLRNFDDRWICFPPGVILTGLAGYLIYSSFWIIPRRTITHFTLLKEALVLKTLSGATDTIARRDLEIIDRRVFGKRKKSRGVYVVDRLGNWWYVNPDTTNFSRLLDRLSSDRTELT